MVEEADQLEEEVVGCHLEAEGAEDCPRCRTTGIRAQDLVEEQGLEGHLEEGHRSLG